jgi:TM2 domain-containing membrane protein YozV
VAQALPQAQVPRQMIVPKNPALGVILSFFIPGLGSIVNGSVGRGVIIMAVDFVGWILAFFIIGIPILIGAWIWGMIDGYLSAQRWNQAHGIIS